MTGEHARIHRSLLPDSLPLLRSRPLLPLAPSSLSDLYHLPSPPRARRRPIHVAAADSEARALLRLLEEEDAAAAAAITPVASGPVEDSGA